MRKRVIPFILLGIFLLTFTLPASAQGYYFRVPTLTIDVYWNEDGTLAADYTFVLINDASGPIEYLDLGLPNSNYNDSDITASVGGNPVSDISSSGFQGTGSAGVAIGLGSYSIPTGQQGTVQADVAQVRGVLYRVTSDSNYASAVFKNPYFLSSVVHGNTDLTVTFHLPPGVQPTEPRWHTAPAGFPSEPQTGIDSQGRIFYSWENTQASPSEQYEFGASFPKKYVPASAIVSLNPFAFLSNIDPSVWIPCGCVGFFIIIIAWSSYSSKRRKLQYLPPKVSIEGHGIKRGLTAVEAAILLEQPLDKVMTMILFGVIKKNAAEVTTKDPLEIKVADPLPDGLNQYEKDFLAAFKEKGITRQKALRDMTVAFVKSVAEKMKGFSRAETIAYYKDITKHAWEQVEAAGTPEVKSQKFDEVMEWTMLDRDYGDRTRDIFHNQPVFIPMWWGRFDPVYSSPRPTSVSMPSARPSGGSSMPTIPGADFAASMVKGVQGFSAGVIGNLSDFTSKVTNATNPPPAPTTSTRSGGGYHSSGGGGCACACACAGCACACAGGGR